MRRAALASSSLVCQSPSFIYPTNIDMIAEQGAIGGTAQKIGGPLDKEGMIGKKFTTEGNIGGSVQNAMGGGKKE